MGPHQCRQGCKVAGDEEAEEGGVSGLFLIPVMVILLLMCPRNFGQL